MIKRSVFIDDYFFLLCVLWKLVLVSVKCKICIILGVIAVTFENDMETLVNDSTIQVPDVVRLSIIPDSFAGIMSNGKIDVAPSNSLKNATTVKICL